MSKLILMLLFFSFFIPGSKAQTANDHFGLNDFTLDSSNRQINLSKRTADGGMLVLTGNEYRAAISPSDYGFSLIRFDVAGVKLWNTYIYGDPSTGTYYKKILEMPDSGIVIMGCANGFGGPGFLVKTDASGNLQWAKSYFVEFLDITVDPSDGGFLITTNSGNSFSGIIKADPNGTITWSDTKDYVPDPDHYYHAARLSNGNYLAVGVAYFNPSLLYGCGLIACYSPTGTLLWSEGLTGPAFVTAYFNFTELPGGNILLAGSTNSQSQDGSWPIMTEIDSTGAVTWSKSYGSGINSFNCGYNFSDNFLYAGGNIFQSSPTVNYPIVLKMDSAGQLVWAHHYPFPLFPANISFGPYNEISFNGSQAGFSNYSTFCMTDTSLTSCYIHDTTFAVTPVTMTTVAMSPVAGGTVLSPVTMTRTNSSSENFVKFDPCMLSGIENSSPEKTLSVVSVFPNPAGNSATFTIDAAIHPQNASLRVYDMLGNEVRRIPVTSNIISFGRNELSGGIYFYRLLNNENVIATGKLIFQ